MDTHYTLYTAKPPGHQHWVGTSLGRIMRRWPCESHRIVTRMDFALRGVIWLTPDNTTDCTGYATPEAC